MRARHCTLAGAALLLALFLCLPAPAQDRPADGRPKSPTLALKDLFMMRPSLVPGRPEGSFTPKPGLPPYVLDQYYDAGSIYSPMFYLNMSKQRIEFVIDQLVARDAAIIKLTELQALMDRKNAELGERIAAFEKRLQEKSDAK